VIHIADPDAGRLEAVPRGGSGKARGVLEAVEALLFGCSDEQAIDDDGGARVTVVGRDPWKRCASADPAARSASRSSCVGTTSDRMSTPNVPIVCRSRKTCVELYDRSEATAAPYAPYRGSSAASAATVTTRPTACDTLTTSGRPLP